MRDRVLIVILATARVVLRSGPSLQTITRHINIQLALIWRRDKKMHNSEVKSSKERERTHKKIKKKKIEITKQHYTTTLIFPSPKCIYKFKHTHIHIPTSYTYTFTHRNK